MEFSAEVPQLVLITHNQTFFLDNVQKMCFSLYNLLINRQWWPWHLLKMQTTYCHVSPSTGNVFNVCTKSGIRNISFIFKHPKMPLGARCKHIELSPFLDVRNRHHAQNQIWSFFFENLDTRSFSLLGRFVARTIVKMTIPDPDFRTNWPNDANVFEYSQETLYSEILDYCNNIKLRRNFICLN